MREGETLAKESNPNTQIPYNFKHEDDIPLEMLAI